MLLFYLKTKKLTKSTNVYFYHNLTKCQDSNINNNTILCAEFFKLHRIPTKIINIFIIFLVCQFKFMMYKYFSYNIWRY